jgi:hypothetical protein
VYSGETVHLFRSFRTPPVDVGGRGATDTEVSGGPLNSPLRSHRRAFHFSLGDCGGVKTDDAKRLKELEK